MSIHFLLFPPTSILDIGALERHNCHYLESVLTQWSLLLGGNSLKFGNFQNFKVKKLLLDRVLWVCYWSRTIFILKELSEYGTKSLRGAYLVVVFSF